MTEWFRRKSKNIKTFDKKDTREGEWKKCPECDEFIFKKVLENNNQKMVNAIIASKKPKVSALSSFIKSLKSPPSFNLSKNLFEYSTQISVVFISNMFHCLCNTYARF